MKSTISVILSKSASLFLIVQYLFLKDTAKSVLVREKGTFFAELFQLN